MPMIQLDHSDGRYSTRALSDDEAARLEAEGCELACVEDGVYDAYLRHCEQNGVWQALWQSISNELYIRRRERELLPLEDAQREIERLKEELARAERMQRFYEAAYVRHHEERHREEHDEHTCVYPQPGCQVDTLPTEWRERAREILDQYSSERAAEGLKAQGCCCGHAHRRLDDAEVARLRGAGFLVEHDAAVA